MAKLIDKKLDKYDDHPCIYYTGSIHRYLRNFKRVNTSEHGRGAIELINILEFEGENCFIPNGKACFLKINIFYLQERL